MQLIEDLRAYQPANEQEDVDRQVIIAELERNPLAFDRSQLAHMACSIWTVDPARTQTLMVYHNIYNSWSWIGGHADGEQDLAAVALRELEEETGVVGTLVDCGPGKIFSCEVLTVNGHLKRGSYVGSHLHLNVTYLAEADPAAPLRIKPDENKGVKWVPLDQPQALSTEPWIRDRIYSKLIAKTGRF